MDNGDVVDRPELLAETSFDVSLYIYDLSKELAKSFKKILKGKPLPGIWHTGIVAFGREYYFGSTGIESCRPGETILGEPDQILTLGRTELPYSVFLEYIFALGESTYKPGTYHLLEHNCNCFSQEVCQFLTGGPIPAEIRELPQEISSNKNLSGPLKEYFDKLSLRAEGSRGISFGPATNSANNGKVPEEQRNGHSNHQQEQQPKQNGTRRKKSSTSMSAKEAKEVKQKLQAAAEVKEPAAAAEVENGAAANGAAGSDGGSGAPLINGIDAASPTNNGSAAGADDTEDSSTTYTPRRCRRYEDPPILYPNVDGPALLKRLMEIMEGKLNPEEVKDLNEFMEYLTTDGGAWALGTSHLETVGRLLNDRNLPHDVPVLTLQMFQAAGLKEDVILLLHQDREKHHLMTYFNKIEFLSLEEQTEIVGLMCNMCSNGSSYDWLTYISEWEEEGKPCNNSKVTVRVAVHGLLAEHPPTRDRGCALVYNLALKKELFDDIATELAMAVMQFLQSPPSEELMNQSLTALLRFMIISYNEIPALMKMLGPDVDAFKGTSARIDALVEQIQMKLRVAR
ncbi:hypothetical protein JTE90_023315 [Oedothorax gibbosus]|uniref:PPPDE domain-containing protein n=1 Tax=Oedothorax gibbosus TaxID=931172 RepID=A0AAV6VHI2_9ARAC|nr:hypothetical protein JTE90_023315 [Oedothorax gibbosus]